MRLEVGAAGGCLREGEDDGVGGGGEVVGDRVDAEMTGEVGEDGVAAVAFSGGARWDGLPM